MKTRSAILSIAILLAAFFTACEKPTPPAESASAKRYEFRGTIVSVNKAAKTATIDHEAVPGYMEAMTMDFPIHEDWVWEELRPGAQIRAELVVDNTAKDPFWLEKIGITAAPDPNQPLLEEMTPEQIGKSVPEIPLKDQDGKTFTLKDYKGKALAVTFIYRECPLPEFCIKMSKQFSDMAKQIASDPAAKDKARLLSISFDPARDTPEKLKQYGLGYLGPDAAGDLSVWRLAVGGSKETREIADFFGLKYEIDANDKTQINHSLVTAVISPDGKVVKIYTGNRWTTDELLAELKSASN